jgi:hypothetical protein
MKKLTHWIAATFMRDYDKTSNLKVRARYGMIEGWTGIIINSVQVEPKFSYQIR